MLDTSVLLADPSALFCFAEHEIVIPFVVVEELEGKRHHPELGWAARTVLRHLEDLRVRHGSLSRNLPINDQGGTVRVEMNHRDTTQLPEGFRVERNDDRLLVVALNLANEGSRVTVVSKDLPLRLRADLWGVHAEEYRHELADRDDWTGFVDLDTDQGTIDRLYADRETEQPELVAALNLPCNTGLVLRNGSQSALTRITPDKQLRLVRGDREVFGIHGKSAQQRIALEHLMDPDIGVVSIGGQAGSGKTLLALAAGLEQTMELQQYRRVIVFRPMYAVGGQDLGYLPGDQDEKMAPWAAAVHDALDAMTTEQVIDHIVDRGMLEVLPLTHIRGRTLVDTFVIIDEAQNLERMVLLTALTRIGQGSKVVLTHDVTQRDNLRVGRYDGIAWVTSKMKGDPLFAHITLGKAERSPIAGMVTRLLNDEPV